MSVSLHLSGKIILEAILTKQTNYGVGGSHLWHEKKFVLYPNRIEYQPTNSTPFDSKPSIISLKLISKVDNDISSKSVKQFVITFKSKEKLVLKAQNSDDRKIWIEQINQQLSRLNDSNSQQWTWKQRESEIEHNGNSNNTSNDIDTNICFLSNKNQKNKSSIQNVATFRFSLANEEIGKGNASKTMDKLISNPELIAKYAESGKTKIFSCDKSHKSQEFLRMSRIIDRKIKQQEIRNNKLLFLNRYYPLRQIAFGPFGHIVLSKDTKKNKYVIMQLSATKKINSMVGESMNILKNLKSKYTFQLVENGSNNVVTYGIYSCNILMRLSGLIGLLPNKRMKPSLAVKFGAEVFELMKCLHRLGIVLNAMSPQELYISTEGNILFMDFTEFIDTTIYIGNNNYVPPEYFLNQTNNKTSDIWRFGVFLYELLVGVPPFWDLSEKSTITAIKNVMFKFPNFISKNAKDLVAQLLMSEPSKRLGFKNIDNIMKHHFFNIIVETETLEMLLKTFTFSSTVIWPCSILIHEDNDISKMITETNSRRGSLRSNKKTKHSMQELLKMNESTSLNI